MAQEKVPKASPLLVLVPSANHKALTEHSHTPGSPRWLGIHRMRHCPSSSVPSPFRGKIKEPVGLMNPKRNEATEKCLQKQRALDVLCSIDRNSADREYSRVEDIWGSRGRNNLGAHNVVSWSLTYNIEIWTQGWLHKQTLMWFAHHIGNLDSILRTKLNCLRKLNSCQTRILPCLSAHLWALYT